MTSVGLESKFLHTPFLLSKISVYILSKQHRCYENQPGHLGSHSRLFYSVLLLLLCLIAFSTFKNFSKLQIKKETEL